MLRLSSHHSLCISSPHHFLPSFSFTFSLKPYCHFSDMTILPPQHITIPMCTVFRRQLICFILKANINIKPSGLFLFFSCTLHLYMNDGVTSDQDSILLIYICRIAIDTLSAIDRISLFCNPVRTMETLFAPDRTLLICSPMRRMETVSTLDSVLMFSIY